MKYLPFILMLICFKPLHASNYYFSSSAGNDSRSASEAQNPSTPWKTLDKLNAVFNSLSPGDYILFKRDDVFDGSIMISRSGSSGNPITFGAYGSGAKPVINGFSTATNWVSSNNGIWESSLSTSTMVNTVLINNVAKAIGRYPNLDAANKGYLFYESYNGTSITDNDLSATPDWTGGEVVIRKARWVIDRNLITRHSGHTIEYISESSYWPANKYGYFIQNHPKTLDIEGEWYYKTTEKKLGIYSPSGNPASLLVQASTIDNLVSITNQNNIAFDNLSFQGANLNAFNLTSAQYISITNCDILYSGVNAINGANTNNLTLDNSSIDHTNNTALNLVDCSYLTVTKNKIKNSGMVAGMGKGDSGGYEAILENGDNVLIEQNEIENTGYIAITFRGNLNTINKNLINNFSLTKDDAAGIYTWNNIPNSPEVYGNKITGNLIINGIGAGEGTEYPDYLPANGIYMDDNTANVEITGNSVGNCSLYGMYMHNARNLTILNNTMFNNGSTQIIFNQDEHAAASPVRQIKMLHNIMFATTPTQHIAQFSSPFNDIADYGIMDSNFYCRPIDENAIIYTSYQVNGTYNNNYSTLDHWKELFGKDLHTVGAPVTISSVDQVRFEYNPTLSSKTISLDGLYIDAKNKSYNGSITLEPLSAAALIKSSPGAPTDGCGSGTILREEWDNVDGNNVSDIPLSASPTTTTQLTSFETNTLGDRYGSRIRGYLCPPESGSYTFFISGDDAAELWLSTDENPSNKTKIASFASYTDFHQFDKYPTQRSASINLVQGQHYYVEVLHKEGGGGDHLTVAWQLPDGAKEIPIPGRRLSPFTNTASTPTNGLNYKYYEGDWNGVPDFTALNPVKTGTTPNIDLGVRNNNDHFGVLWEGKINIPSAGDYTFETVSDDGSNLYFNSLYSPGASPVVNNDGLHSVRSATGTVHISAPGKYPVAMTFIEKEGEQVMQVYWSGPGISRQLIPDAAFTGNTVVPTDCSGTGSILREQWDNVGGNDVSNIPLSRAPSSTTLMNALESHDVGDNYGVRIRGYVCPPQSGDYTFLISGDDAVELWLSTDDNPANKRKIASFLSWTDFRQFDKFASQRSASINLQTGQRYYIEVLQKEGGGGDHVTVAWQLPNGATEIPVPGSRLLPYNTSSVNATSQFSQVNTEKITTEQGLSVTGSTLTATPNPFKISATIRFTAEESGNATVNLYDLQGRLVQNLFKGNVQPGVSRTFQAHADKLKSGLYIIQLITKTKVLSQKIVLAR